MRALVSIFSALLIIISLYQLSFTWFVNKHESTIDAKAKRYVNSLYPAGTQKYPGDKEAQADEIGTDTTRNRVEAAAPTVALDQLKAQVEAYRIKASPR